MNNFLSLMLGLSHGDPEISMDYPLPTDSPTHQLERAHAVIAGRILERNKHDHLRRDWPTTREIDLTLLSVAKSLPETYWRLPSFANIRANTEEAFAEQTRLIDQIFHYNLVHLLHLPFLLGNEDDKFHTYSKTTCVNASREILCRVIAFRGFNHKTCDCRLADFLALMAGMSILLAHIDSHQASCGSWYAHQRLGDRAMVEQTIDNMEAVAKHTGDTVTGQSSAVLRSLLKVETLAAQGQTQSHCTTLTSLEDQCNEVQLPIPYFGIIKIGPQGIITKECGNSAGSEKQPNVVHIAGPTLPSSTGQPLYQDSNAGSLGPISTAQPLAAQASQMAMIAADHSIPHQQTLYPGLTADVSDWAFQGVDAAFFDSLMMGTGAGVDWEQTLQATLNNT